MPEAFDPAELDLPADIRAMIAREQARPLVYLDGEYLIRQKTESVDTFLVLQGACVVEVDVGDEQPPRPIAILIPSGDKPTFLGEMAYLGSTMRTASVRCTGATYVLALAPREVDAMMEEFPRLTGILCRQLTERLDEANQLNKSYADDLELVRRELVVEPGEAIVTAGSPSTTLYQLVDGRCEGAELAEGFIDPLTFLRGAAWTITTRAVVRCLVVGIDAGSREAFIRKYPRLVLQLLDRSATTVG